jgi:hypothetical protein
MQAILWRRHQSPKLSSLCHGGLVVSAAMLQCQEENMSTKRIGFLGYDGLQALDLVGPLEAFMTAVDEESDGNVKQQARYEVVVIGLTKEPFTAETGIMFHPHKTIDNLPALDTLIIPGGKSLRSGDTSGRISEWLKERAGKIRRIVQCAPAFTPWLQPGCSTADRSRLTGALPVILPNVFPA